MKGQVNGFIINNVKNAISKNDEEKFNKIMKKYNFTLDQLLEEVDLAVIDYSKSDSNICGYFNERLENNGKKVIFIKCEIFLSIIKSLDMSALVHEATHYIQFRRNNKLNNLITVFINKIYFASAKIFGDNLLASIMFLSKYEREAYKNQIEFLNMEV